MLKETADHVKPAKAQTEIWDNASQFNALVDNSCSSRTVPRAPFQTANARTAQHTKLQVKTEGHASQLHAPQINSSTLTVFAPHAQDIPDMFKLQVENHVSPRTADWTNTSIAKLNADHAQLTNALTHNKMDAMLQPVTIEKLSLTGRTVINNNAHHILEAQEPTVDNVLPSNATVDNIFQEMVDATIAQITKSQILEIKTEINACNQTAH